jgi:site-specific recombinase XerD
MDQDWVFANQLGGPIEHRNDLREWKTVLAEAQVRNVRLHDARHTYATTLLASGIDQRIVIDMLGWSRVSMTERYQHVVPEMRREAARQAENKIWGS